MSSSSKNEQKISWHRGRVISKSIKGDICVIELSVPTLTDCRPGQFFEVSLTTHQTDPFLNRPLSIYNFVDGRLSFLVKIKGRGTRLLSEMEGDIDVLGPLGNGFDMERVKGPGTTPLLLAGGIGVAPLAYLRNTLLSRGKNPKLLWAVREGRQIKNCPADLCDCTLICADDGDGYKRSGIIELLEETVQKEGEYYAYVCGSHPFTAAVAGWLKARSIKGEASLESMMGCGWGGCNGCNIRLRDRVAYVCKDGPVFDIDEIC